MRFISLLLIALLLAAAGCATVQHGNGSAAPAAAAAKAAPGAKADCEWSRQKGGFGASVIVSPDPRWKDKRGGPAWELPARQPLNLVRVGSKVWALIFLNNPLPDASGELDVTCDVRTIRPNGRVTVHRGLCALRRKESRHKANTYLAEFVVTMTGEERDPVGEWVMEIAVRDCNRGVEVPIVCRYTLLPKDRRVAALYGAQPES
jgi:hypothetical protein